MAFRATARALLAAPARSPSISFPVRVRPDGKKVSDLPLGASAV
jgi:hypothetical protein|tara:strand:+ start:421 stop:552 length:132 start_codon:yes stop_codon:yes gene_type:complete